jgi:hypothetical protein
MRAACWLVETRALWHFDPGQTPSDTLSAVNERVRNLAFVACVLVLVVGALALVGIRVRSSWDSFVPDVIVGVIGAGSIAGLIAWFQRLADDRRTRDGDVSSAYRSALEAVSDIRGIDYNAQDAVKPIRVFTIRLTILGELLADEEPFIERWFEAERQLMLYRATTSGNAMKELEEDDEMHTLEDILAATAPLNEWTAEFTNNLRFWRRGRVSREQIEKQSETIERGLKKLGAWSDDALPWRRYFGSASGDENPNS